MNSSLKLNWGMKGAAAIVAVVFVSQLTLAREGGIEEYDGREPLTTSNTVPKEIQGTGITEHLGKSIDPTMTFKDETGATVTLGQYIDGKTPTIISPVYYSCPGLCNFHLNGIVEGLKGVDWNVGQNFKMVAISFDSKEAPELAAKKKETFMKIYNRPGTEKDWHFLTADAETIKKFTDSVGFSFKWNEEAKEWAHASAAIVVSPKGEITRYLPGIMFDPKDIKLALNESSRGQIGGFVEGLVLYCFSYDRHQNKYTLAIFNVMKLAGALTVLLLAAWLVPVWMRARKDERPV